MRIFIQIFTALALLLAGAASASAETLKVKANTVKPVVFYYMYTPLGYGCATGGKPKVRIGREPEHGTLKTEWRKSTMNADGGCKGKPATGVAVWYIPNKGYRGPDRFSFTATIPGVDPGAASSVSRHMSYKVIVE